MTLMDMVGLLKDNYEVLLFLVAAALSVIQIAPIKINPWSAMAKAVRGMLNRDVIKELEDLRHDEAEYRWEIREALDTYKSVLDGIIQTGDERNADLHRYRIFRFNTELLRDVKHTEEEYNEVLHNIKGYEQYCKTHPLYENNRAVFAIENIERAYKERMVKRDFLDYRETR